VAGLAKTGLRPVPRPSLRGGVARGFAGLGEPVGLSSWVGGVRYGVLSRWRAVCIRIVDYARAIRERFRAFFICLLPLNLLLQCSPEEYYILVLSSGQHEKRVDAHSSHV
jgi:hypothetical protein